MNTDYGSLVEQILRQRNLADADSISRFLKPSYELHLHDPWLMPDMKSAVERIEKAHEAGEKVVIYGDYDIDGLTASTVLSEAFDAFGIEHDIYIPDRFEEGYGLNENALDEIAKMGADLVITVDCGSVSFAPIQHANSIGLDVIVTDHHTVGESLPEAIAVINPKRSDSKYPFIDLAGVGVAFKLVCALQSRIDGLPKGQEKWLLDLVALGSVCDVVDLVDENRAIVYWGLKVASKTRRHGLRALAEVSDTNLNDINTTSFGFRFGPRLNASGRLENARKSLDLLRAKSASEAHVFAQDLDRLNSERRTLQTRIFNEADELAGESQDPVLILGGKGWSQGVVGIVAAKLLEKYKKPTFVFEMLGETMKGSARSYGDFKAVDAVRAADTFLISGGGHAAAAGCTLATENFEHFKAAVIDYYNSLGLNDQQALLEPGEDLVLESSNAANLEFLTHLSQLEPHGNANPRPIFRMNELEILDIRFMGQSGDHVRVKLLDKFQHSAEAIGFNMKEDFENLDTNQINIWFHIEKNVFRGIEKAQIRLVKVAKSHLLG